MPSGTPPNVIIAGRQQAVCQGLCGSTAGTGASRSTGYAQTAGSALSDISVYLQPQTTVSALIQY